MEGVTVTLDEIATEIENGVSEERRVILLEGLSILSGKLDRIEVEIMGYKD